MPRRLSVVIAFVGVLGLLGLAPVSHASHDLPKKSGAEEPSHEQLPDPPPEEFLEGNLIGACTVTGRISIGNASGNGGIGIVGVSNKSHNHYRFEDTQIVCVSGDPNFNGNFSVDAAGGTDGPNEGGGNHGEDAAVGWSHSSCYDDDNAVKAPQGCDPPAMNDKVGAIDDLYDGENVMGVPNHCNNCGEIEVAQQGGATASCTPGSRFAFTHQCQDLARDNVIMFCRGEFVDQNTGNVCPASGGSHVIAWGVLHGTNTAKKGQVVCIFVPGLTFTPTNGDGGFTKKFDQAVLTGDAALALPTDNNKRNCFGVLKGKKE